MNILESLYEACLNRMQVFLDELPKKDVLTEDYSDFRNILRQIDKHPNRQYFIYKSIIINNLHGVDIMEEAGEICKLRLFLKLVAQVDRIEDIEPLPDIDFNIQAGNTLVGFTTRDEVRKAITTAEHGQKKLLFGEDVDTMASIERSAEIADRAFKKFQEMQTEQGMDVKGFSAAKQELSNRLKTLEDELDRYLASEYGINRSNIRDDDKYEKSFIQWRESHQPFHWFIEFYGIMKNGGFDVIIGNPPYVEYNKVKKEYTLKGYLTIECGNLYSYILERCFVLQRECGYVSMIVQNSIVCTDRMIPIQELILNNYDVFIANFDDRPAKLFTGLNHMKGSIIACVPRKNNSVFSASFLRWYDEFRPHTFELIEYAEVTILPKYSGHIPKISSKLEIDILKKISNHKPLRQYINRGSHIVYCHRIASYFIKAIDFVPYFWNEKNGQKKSEDYKIYETNDHESQQFVMCILNSGIFYYYWHVYHDGYHCGKATIENFRFPISIQKICPKEIQEIGFKLSEDYKRHIRRRETFYKTTGNVIYDEFFPKKSKSIFDEIDDILSKYYAFTDEELDFIKNYDIKYRMGLM